MGFVVLHLRLQNYPMGAGKGWDTVLLCEWLEHELSQPGGSARVDALLMFSSIIQIFILRIVHKHC